MSEFLEDLLKDSSESFEDGNYFLVTITELELGTTYPLEFRWKYKDGTFGKDWSAVKAITSPFKTVPNTPQFLSTNVTGGEGGITIEWNGKDTGGNDLTDVDRIEVWISEPPFDSTKPVYQSKTKFKTQIQAPAGSYTVALYAVTVNGEYSSVSSAYTVTVTGFAQQIDPPTLPSGLSVAPAPFAVSVNWNGSYSSGGFDGFKSIDIHVRGSDVGATATSGFSTTTQVATLTVDSTTNRQNVGLDNLRQALSLASNAAAYTAPMFFYYIARNQNDALYSVSGTPTYTRINSTTVNPTQANFIDLANGVISIENLVAGNGQFSSWLRTGSAGGTRIELSAINDFSNSGNIVQKGLVAYSSGSTEIFNLDIDAGTLTINGSGTFTGNLSIGSSNSIFKAEPATGIWLGNASYGSAPFSVSVNGALKAESGNIAGWQLNPTFLQNTSGTFKISSTNSDPQIQVGSDGGGHVRISSLTGIAHYSSGTTLSGKFTLSPTGTSTISGWTIGTNTISKGTTIINASETNGYIQIGSGSSFFKVSSSGIQLGNETFNDAPFRVTPAGALTATNATITGNITANSGTFNGTINATGGTFSGSITASGTISGGTISGATLSGGLIRTGTTGSRILISGSDQGTNPNAITFINPGGSPSAHIVPLNIGGTTYGLLMHEGGTADQTGGTYPQLFVGNGGVTMSARQFSGGPQGLVSVSNSGVAISGTNGADVNVTGPITFSATMFAPNLSTSTSGTNLRVTTGTIGEIQETSASSVRYKENIQNLTLSSELNPSNLLNLPVRSFTYKDGYVSDSDDRYNKVLPGFIAEEVEEHYPIAVDYAEGQPHTWNERFIVPGILALVQNLNQQLINIKSRLDALEG